MKCPQKISILVLFLLLLLLCSVVRAGRLRPGTVPKEADFANYKGAVCSELDGDYRVCKVMLTYDGDAEYEVFHKDKIVNSFNAPFWSTADAAPEDFWTYRGDLDNDGSREIVLVSGEGVSNGMGVTYVTVHILSDPMMLGKKTHVKFPLKEFGPGQSFIFNPKNKRTEILVTYWADSNSLDPRRGWGTYLFGKWFRYDKGKLKPILSRPIRARRFLNSFARIRDNGSYPNRYPYKWLSSSNTHRFYDEPMPKDGRLHTECTGTVSNYDADTGNMAIACDDGTSLYATLKPENATNTLIYFDTIGFWKSKYRLPNGFEPIVVMDNVRDKRVRIQTYRNDWEYLPSSESAFLWFLDR